MPNARSEDVDAYIAKAPARARPLLRQLRRTIRDAAPGAVESISYQMPYYAYHGRLIYFALMRDWVGLYMLGGAKKRYGQELAPYLSGVSTARFPLGKPLPAALVRNIVLLRVEENLASEKKRAAKSGAAGSRSR